MSSKTIEMTKKKKKFKYTVFSIVGKVRVYIIEMAEQDTGAQGVDGQAGSNSRALLGRG